MSDAAAVAAVRAYARSGRRRRRTWYDRYLVVFVAVVLAVFAVRPVWAAAARVSGGRTSVTGVMLVVSVFVAVLGVARVFGPVVVSPQDAYWLVPSPLDRRAVLRPAAVRLLVVSVVLGGVLGVAALVFLGAPGDLPVRLAAAAVLGASLTVAGTASLVAAQGSSSGDWPATVLLAVALAAGLVALTAHADRLPGLRVFGAAARAPASAGVVAALAVAAGAVFLARSAWRSLERFPARAVREASLRSGARVTMVTGLDPGLVATVAEEAYWRRRRLRSRPWPRLPGAAALAWQDWRVLSRRPRRLLTLALSACVPAAALPQGARPSLFLTAMLLGGALAAASSGTPGARRDAGAADEAASRRLLAVGPGALLAARAVLPALLAAAWLTLALAALVITGVVPLGAWPAAGLAVSPALGAAALRMARRGPVDHGLPPLDTPFGPLPSGLLLWAATGLDVALAGCAPLEYALAYRERPVPALAVEAGFALAVAVAYVRWDGRRRG